jgi:restriction system protein
VFGLGYNLLLLVYEKNDDRESQTTSLTFRNVVFIPAVRTGDYQLTRGLLQILAHDANVDDVDALIEERNLPLDEIGRRRLAEQIVAHPPEQGYITVSNALQWRLQYGHAIRLVGTEDGEGLENLLEG